MILTKLSTTETAFEDVYAQAKKMSTTSEIRYLFYPQNGKLAENIIVSPKSDLCDSALVISRPVNQQELIVSDENLGQAIINHLSKYSNINIATNAKKYVELIQQLANKYNFNYKLQTDQYFSDDLSLLQNSHLETKENSLFYKIDTHTIKLLINKCNQFYQELIANLNA